jgi:nuclear pore complex protein Nup62
MASAIGTFISTVVSRLRGGDGSALASYPQIGFYQLERPMNHAGLYPNLPAGSAQQLLTAASAALRQAETQALQGAGVSATPISIGASFDFELIQQGAIAGVSLDAGVEQRSQDSLKKYLMGFTWQNIDAINVEWFPRSFSSGDIDHFATLLRTLKQSYADKQLTLATGFSSAFNPPDQALQFYSVTISNLGSYRASEGVDSKFLGVVFQQAFKGTAADAPLPAGTPDPSQWKWNDRALQLAALWSQGKTSPDMTWWVNKVQDNMGLTTMQPTGTGSSNLAPLPSLQALQAINSTLTQASQQVQAPPSYTTAAGAVSSDPTANPSGGSAAAVTNPGSAFVPSPVATGYVPGAPAASQTAASPFQQLLFNLLQEFTQQISAKLMMKLGGSNPVGQNYNASYSGLAPSSAGTSPYSSANSYSNATTTPTSRSTLANTVWIGPADINLSTTTPAMGQPVAITVQVHNQSADQDISGLTVQLVNPANPAAASSSMQSGVMVPRSGVTPVQLSWAPEATSLGQIQLVLQALDSSGQIVTSVSIPKITVPGTGNPTSSAGSGAAGATGNLQVTSPSYTGANPDPSAQNPSTNSTIPANSPSGTTPAPAPSAQLAVTWFGLSDPNATVSGQVPQLTAQVSNPSPFPTQSGQAQLFMDGTPQQMQTIGSLLPSGALPLQFSPIQTTTGQHNLQLVVTTADGVSASANFAANVTAATSTTSSGNSSASSSQPTSGASGRATRPVITLRAAAPTVFQIGNVMRATTTAPRGIPLAGNHGATAANATPSAANPSQSSPPAAHAMVSSTTAPHPSVSVITPSPGTAQTNAMPPQGNASAPVPAVRTISPRVSTPTQTPATSLATQTPLQPSTQGSVRTITPPSAPSTTPPSAPSTSSTVRTITPPSAPSTSSTVRTITPPSAPSTSSTVRTITPPSAPSAAGKTVGSMKTPTVTGGAARASTPATQPGAKPSSATPGNMDLGISAQDIHLVPVSPRAGQVTTFTAAIKNSGTLAAQGASVVFVLVANGQQVAASQPMTFNVPGHGIFQAKWSASIPAARNLQLVVTVMANGDANPMNNRAIVPVVLTTAPVQTPMKPR